VNILPGESIYKNIGIIENDIITKINGNEINQVPIDLAENFVKLNENKELIPYCIQDGTMIYNRHGGGTMSRQVLISKEELRQAKQHRDQAASMADYRKALSVILVGELGLTAEHVSDILGISRRTVFRDRDNIRSQDDTAKKSWGGRRHCAMTVEEEQEFLAQWEKLATVGGVLTVPPIHAALVERLGYNTPMSTTYRLLARHGWRKVQPDTKHPKSDPALQDEFKKNSPKNWLPPA